MLFLNCYTKLRNEEKNELNKYKNKLSQYEKSYAQYIEKLKLENDSFIKKLQQYEIDLKNYATKRENTIKQFNETLCTLETTLTDIYNINIIYPKYRNFVAITAINEYLSCGRCDKLEGPDGAYNLFENEVRQNLIISQLSSIVDNLEELKSNQYSLYLELTKTNKLVTNIIDDIKNIDESAKLTAYFAEITAKAATAPTFYVGMKF